MLTLCLTEATRQSWRADTSYCIGGDQPGKVVRHEYF
jgi:hypothetical protein